MSIVVKRIIWCGSKKVYLKFIDWLSQSWLRASQIWNVSWLQPLAFQHHIFFSCSAHHGAKTGWLFQKNFCLINWIIFVVSACYCWVRPVCYLYQLHKTTHFYDKIVTKMITNLHNRDKKTCNRFGWMMKKGKFLQNYRVFKQIHTFSFWNLQGVWINMKIFV